MIRNFATVLLLVPVIMVGNAHAETAQDWVARSDQNAQVLLEVLARFNPEAAGFLGIEGMDEAILELAEDVDERRIKAMQTAIATLNSRHSREADARVRLDLEILIGAAQFNIEQIRLQKQLMIPYFNLGQIIFGGIRPLLNDQNTPEQRAAAAMRLRRYAGLEEGYMSLEDQAESLIRASLVEGELIFPFRGQIDRDLQNSDRYVSGIRDLLETNNITDCEEAVDAIIGQLRRFDDFLKHEVLPRARDDFRQPPEMYSHLLKGIGVDMPVSELISRAHVAFREIQNEMQVIARLVAAQNKLDSSDYRDVIRHLKKQQLQGEQILTHYTSRIGDLERIIKEEGVVTLPQRDMRVRLASEAESVSIPSPFMLPPKIIGNTGEVGEFVLPLRITNSQEQDPSMIDDFTFAAASWTLAVHEGRPGHELQYTSMIENGVSLARSIFAFNSVNVEGWAVYAEAEMKQYFPLEGQLISLQQRLLRAARAFLDPGLQSGAISEDEAIRLLEQDVVISSVWARQELDRYSFNDPAQATSYFCGYLRLMELRAEVECQMGARFDRQKYHDFILAQGLLPPRLMRKAVMEGFVGEVN